jgi:2-dehydropantoate 2-reductase
VKILVVGAGAVGSVFGGRLSGAGHAVQLLGRPEHVRAIRAHGLRVEGTSPGMFHPDALSDLADATEPEIVLLTVKTFDIASAVGALVRRFPCPRPTLLPQNGLNVENLVAQSLRSGGGTAPLPWLVRAVNTVPVTWVGPGVVRQAGAGELVLRDPSVAHPAADAARVLRDLFSAAGISVRTVPDLERELWRKSLVNAAINPVTAIHRVPNGRLLEYPYREESVRLLREAQRAAQAAGFPFEDSEADGDLERVVRATAENRSSMLQDIERRRPTEIDAISGEILATALAHGFDLPESRAVIERLRATVGESSERPQSS